MKDIQNKEFEVGDKVAFINGMNGRARYLQIGVIKRLTPKSMYIGSQDTGIDDPNVISKNNTHCIILEKNTTQKEPIKDEDKEYTKINREDFIDELIRWISEANSPLLNITKSENDIVLMKKDLQYLMSLPDEEILSSNSTNNYIAISDNPFLYRDTLLNNTKKDN